jgi:hypothetical protein
MMDYDHELRMAQMEGERRAMLALARAAAALRYQRELRDEPENDGPSIAPGQLHLVVVDGRLA